MVNQAAIQASREGASSVKLNHFEWAKDKILMGAERKTAAISDKEKLMTAYHEGGHALAALYTEGAMPLHKVTCVPRGHSLGMTTQLPENDRTSQTYTEFLATIDVCMGGRVAEELVYGKNSVTSGASSDIQKATQVARSMVKYYGYSDKLGPVFMADEEVSPQVKGQVDEEVRKLVNEGVFRVTALLTEKKDELDKLAHALVEYETLNGEEVKKVIKGERIRSVLEPMEEVDMSKDGGVRLD
ncbi:hypothetical protein FRC03_010299 [Tulasnella sp. 419]|nr:hypothetical protein FRC03_010299 [Tulasnella sp. 419]